ncbi:MAG: phosphonate C-P lyase system protein PhnG [Pseudomonadota bacterium]
MTESAERQAWLGLLARAPAPWVAELWDGIAAPPTFSWLRPPETGAVMVQGRMGGTGQPFNLGEMTVTRCALRLASGEVGHGYVQGRDKTHAETAALCDALMQSDRAAEIRAGMLDPLTERMEEARHDKAAKAAATKVDFFTLVRGED